MKKDSRHTYVRGIIFCFSQKRSPDPEFSVSFGDREIVEIDIILRIIVNFNRQKAYDPIFRFSNEDQISGSKKVFVQIVMVLEKLMLKLVIIVKVLVML